MKILVGFECSGVVRDAFLELGHTVISCDLQPTRSNGPHYQGSIWDIIHYPFDLAILHPECTDLAVSGAKHFKEKQFDGRQYVSMATIMRLVKETEHIPRVCIENPISIISSLWRKPDQIIQPWMFGHGETKATCLWLKGLPKLEPTNIVEGREPVIHRMPPSADRKYLRSKTYEGIAKAMANQWSIYDS